MKKMKYDGQALHAIIMTALITAIAVVVNFFKVDIPIAGAPVMRISFSSPFIRLSSILFGPIYGGISGGLLDILSYILKPVGGYLPPLTLTAILNGILVGIIWSSLKRCNIKTFKSFYITMFSLVGAIGIVNYIFKTFLPNSILGNFILSIGKKSAYATEGFIIAAIIGFILFIAAEIISKKSEYLYETYLKVIISAGIPSLIVTTINTYFLKLFMPALADKAFLIVLIPRLLEDLFMLPIQAYIIVLLMGVYQRVTRKVLIKEKN